MSLDDLPGLRDVPSVTGAQMAEIDRITIDELGVAVEMLMENASRQIAAAARFVLGGVEGKRIIAIAGTGNNGGDALGAARRLLGWGADARAVLAAPRERVRESARRQLELLARLEVPLAEMTDTGGEVIGETLAEADLLLDGLLGYSTRGAPRGEVAELIRAANRSGVHILAVDLPSGLDPDTGTPLGVAIRAMATVTLALPKTGLLAPGARGLVGELLLADIGIPPVAFGRIGVDTRYLFVDSDLVRILR
ncbi:MAG TPA: NAD(P)H-hydrate epimerase [Candidatus Limnocylindria bacterium]|nr:NAD(P)H-hydrate epimerase [Candidatus Limnocylindria bacterium]